MNTRHSSSAWKMADLLLVAISLLVLVPCVYYPYRYASSPDVGFTLTSTGGSSPPSPATGLPGPASRSATV